MFYEEVRSRCEGIAMDFFFCEKIYKMTAQQKYFLQYYCYMVIVTAW